eukprot:m.42351 g.42351  ORF g.42351 m.42351 type:complete len:226 (-) comp10644_c0_seq1:670-1347(-)
MAKEAKPFNLKRGVQKVLLAHNLVCPLDNPDAARRVVRAMSMLHREQGFTYGMIAQACSVHPSNFNEWLNHGRRPTIGPKVMAFVNACALGAAGSAPSSSPTEMHSPATSPSPMPSAAALAAARKAHKARALKMASQRLGQESSSSGSDDDDVRDHEVPSSHNNHSAPRLREASETFMEFLYKVRSPDHCGSLPETPDSSSCSRASLQPEDECWQAAAALLMLTH